MIRAGTNLLSKFPSVNFDVERSLDVLWMFAEYLSLIHYDLIYLLQIYISGKLPACSLCIQRPLKKLSQNWARWLLRPRKRFQSMFWIRLGGILNQDVGANFSKLHWFGHLFIYYLWHHGSWDWEAGFVLCFFITESHFVSSWLTEPFKTYWF